MKILLVITSLGVGGAERLVTNYADVFVKSGHDVVLAYLYGKAELLPTDRRVQVVNIGLSKNPVSLFNVLRNLRQLIWDFSPDVVNSHLVHANILMRLLRIFTTIPRLISSAHNTNEEGRFRMLAYRLTDSLADISTNVSVGAVDAFIREKAVKPERMIALHNSIDIEQFVYRNDLRCKIRGELDIPENTQLLLAVGRLGASKDYPNLLKSFSIICETKKSIKLLIVGDGPLREKLLLLAKSLNVDSKVMFLGVRHDVPALMSACDFFVLSSAWEGFGLVVAEAMSCNRIVVATDSGGVKEVLGSYGFLVPPSDSTALAKGISNALALDMQERKKLGILARKRIEELYSMEKTAAKWLSLYDHNSVV